jgi:hypothetical protein
VTAKITPIGSRQFTEDGTPTFAYETLGEVFADLAYQIRGGEDILLRLDDFARICAGDAVPLSILRADDDA